MGAVPQQSKAERSKRRGLHAGPYGVPKTTSLRLSRCIVLDSTVYIIYAPGMYGTVDKVRHIAEGRETRRGLDLGGREAPRRGYWAYFKLKRPHGLNICLGSSLIAIMLSHSLLRPTVA